jgi:hypothetical protein
MPEYVERRSWVMNYPKEIKDFSSWRPRPVTAFDRLSFLNGRCVYTLMPTNLDDSV